MLIGIAPMLPQTTDASKHSKHKAKSAKTAVSSSSPILWRRPTDISRRNLFDGPGGKEHRPQPPFTFVKEDMEGSNPKFDVTDATGEKWRVKLGTEARSETAATRFVWAVGYFADEDYYLPAARIEGLTKLTRGNKYVSAGGVVRGARFERKPHGQKKIGDWSWFNNPFGNTHQLNGLKVMMALVNNWDTKDTNNSIYQESNGEIRYVVTDLGATFGKTGGAMFRSEDNVNDYGKSKFVKKSKDGEVDFVMNTRPPIFMIFDVPYYVQRSNLGKIAKDIPAADARWIGGLLSELSENQIEDAFLGSGYNERDARAYTQQIRARIRALNSLPSRN